MLNWQDQKLHDFAESIDSLKNGFLFCERCYNLSDSSLCGICSNPKRNAKLIAVVEKITDLVTMEKTGAFDGIYHVLGGVINTSDGVVADNLRISELVSRIKKMIENNVSNIEVILATSPTTHGDTTALYIEEELRPFGIKITRLARGLSSGSSLEYIDETTLSNALKNRK